MPTGAVPGPVAAAARGGRAAPLPPLRSRFPWRHFLWQPKAVVPGSAGPGRESRAAAGRGCCGAAGRAGSALGRAVPGMQGKAKLLLVHNGRMVSPGPARPGPGRRSPSPGAAPPGGAAWGLGTGRAGRCGVDNGRAEGCVGPGSGQAGGRGADNGQSRDVGLPTVQAEGMYGAGQRGMGWITGGRGLWGWVLGRQGGMGLGYPKQAGMWRGIRAGSSIWGWVGGRRGYMGLR